MARKDTESMTPDETDVSAEVAEIGQENVEITETGDSPANKDAKQGTSEPESAPEPDSKLVPASRLRRFWHWCLNHKKYSFPGIFLGLLVLIGGLLAVIPATRYAIAGTIIERRITVIVVDDQTKKPISSASVNVDGKTVQTSNQGKVTVPTGPGERTVTISKKYYKTTSKGITIGVLKDGNLQVRLMATGRQVPIVVTNKVTGKSLANAVVKASGTEVKTDKDGKAIIVLPADKQTVQAAISANGYNDLKATIQVTTAAASANIFTMTPAGHVYFLSTASGKVDVVKTNLDGSGRETLVAGTGKEEMYTTRLIQSKDGKYLVLHSKRDGGDHKKLFIIETATAKLTTMDEGKAQFEPIGWLGQHFTYKVVREYPYWQPKREALKSYDAATKKLQILDETTAEGSQPADWQQETIGSAYVVANELVYSKNWQLHPATSAYSYSNFRQKVSVLARINPDGTGKRILKEHKLDDMPHNEVVSPSTISYQIRREKSGSLYVRTVLNGQPKAFYTYENGQLKDSKPLNDQNFYESYFAVLVSPDGTKATWHEMRDGKSIVFLGNAAGAEAKVILDSGEYAPLAWHGNDYILLTKGNNEIYVMGLDGDPGLKPQKVSDYYATYNHYDFY